MNDDDRSPFPWIADEVWRRTTNLRTDPELEERWGRTEELLVVAVTEADRRRAPVMPVPEDAPEPQPVGGLDEARALLQKRGGTGYAFPEAVAWLICCDRLATLVDHPAPESLPSLPHWTVAEGTSEWGSPGADFSSMDAPPTEPRSRLKKLFGGRDPAADYQEDQRRALEGIDGTHLLQCRSCGRLYFACHHP